MGTRDTYPLLQRARPYGVALAAGVVALVICYLLDSWLGNTYAHPLLIAAVALAALFAGSGPALTVALLGGLATQYLFVEPRGSLLSSVDFTGLVLYAFTCAILIAFGERVRGTNRGGEVNQPPPAPEEDGDAREALRAHENRLQEAIDAAEESCRRLQATLNAAAEGLAIFDTRGSVLTFNATMARLHGLADNEEATSVTLEEYTRLLLTRRADGTPVSPEHWPVMRALRGETVLGEELEVSRIDRGHRIIASYSAVPLRDASGAVSQVVLSAHDLTERKRAEEALRESEYFHSAVLDSLPIEIAVLDRQGRIVAINSLWLRFARAAGADAGKVAVGVNYLEICRAASAHGDALAQTALEGLIQVLEGHGAEFQMEYPCHAPDRKQWFRMHVMRPTRDIGGAVVAHIDITQRMAAEAQLREREARLEASDRQKDEFLATLAHELRNPLAPIRNAAQLLKLTAPQDALVQRAREIIDRQLQYMVRLVDDLLDVSRISRGQVTLRKEPIVLQTVMANAVEAAQPVIDAADHQLTVSVGREPICLEGDETRLVQVVLNLLNNAAKYTPPGGRIELRAWREGNRCAVLSVRDTGIGIPHEERQRIFDLFTQVERSTEHAHGGLGIGLTLVRRLVELHGGRVEAHSEGPGKGSEFIVRLPIPLGAAAVRPEGSLPERAR